MIGSRRWAFAMVRSTLSKWSNDLLFERQCPNSSWLGEKGSGLTSS